MEIQWTLVLFTAIAGAGAWLFVCIGIDEFKGLTKKVAFPSALLSVILLGIGGICSVMHLSHPERMLEALNHPTSGIFIEALLLGILAVVALVYAVLVKRELSAAARKVLAVIGIVVAIAFSFSCGHSYLMSAHETWNTMALPLGYLGTAAASGTALFLLLCALRKESGEAVRFAGIETIAGAVLGTVLAVVYGVISGAATGEVALLFWAAVILCGGIAPIIAGFLAYKKPDTALLYAVIACAGALIGSIAFRAMMWLVAAQLMSLFGVVIGH